MSTHVEPIRTYILVFLALMVLTALTVFVAYFDFGALNNVVAMGIAILKAALVVMIFMHVRHSSPLIKLTLAGGFLWLLILFVLTMTDYPTRGLFGIAGK